MAPACRGKRSRGQTVVRSVQDGTGSLPRDRASVLARACVSSCSFESESSLAAVLLCYWGWLSDFIRKGPGRAQRKLSGGISHSCLGWYPSLGGEGPGPRGACERWCVLPAHGASPDNSQGWGWVFWGHRGQKEEGGGRKGRPPEEEDMLWSAPRERFREVLWFGPRSSLAALTNPG